MKVLIVINIMVFMFLQFGRPSPILISIQSAEAYETAHNKAAKQLLIHPDTLQALFWLESGSNPNAINPYTRAHGRIQWMPNTAKAYGLDTTELKTMPAIDQLTYEVEYLKPATGGSLSEFYFRIFFPAAMNKPDNWVLKSKRLTAWRVAKYNKGYDLNKDSCIQVWEVKKAINEKIKLMR